MELTKNYLNAVLDDLRVQRGDTTDIEVKRSAKELPRDIGATISAFANMPSGGLLILGVDEASDFSISGVSDPATIEAGIVSVTRSTVSPPPQLTTETIHYDGIAVVMVRVASLPAQDKPARYKGEAYLRQADGDYVMSPTDIHMLEVTRLNDVERIQYDAESVPGTSPDDLDDDLTTAFLNRARNTKRLRDQDDLSVLKQLAIVTHSNELTVAGLYALGIYPQGRLPALQVTAAVQLPRDGGNARTQNLRHFDGPLPILLEELMEWTVANLTSRQEYMANGHLRNVLEMPSRAIREAIANALVHRDLGPDTVGYGKSVQIRISEKALTIISPGGLRGLTLSQITSSSPAQVAVNQRLYRIAKDLRTSDGENIIEGEGGGVKEILRSTMESDLRRPRLSDNGVQFVAKLWRGSAFSNEDTAWLKDAADGRELTHLQKQVMLKARDEQPRDIEALRSEFSPLTSEEAREQLSQLVRWHLLETEFDSDARQLGPREEQRVRQPDSNSQTSPVASESDSDSRLTKNAPAVFDAISSGSSTVAAIAESTGLTTRQTRYAIKDLLAHSLILMEGGQGHRTTNYRAS
ncbi:MAG: RNA-binding domain-containing protein [Brevibacterium sp.]|uniref:ATP-dependent DNA helicase RecG n=2 Tax=Brevibacterium linens TaxID=1703 RepID=A0A2H1KCS2_BRELN|nr:RNA-binding domain-containing protein [Brevibacterium linens]KAB1946291.1 ATPase [Brevibacterium linens ATCC 9172]SMX95792.1 ATP-dependent DNA helicase RecG [Brevibacterium linens ATCC 9172]SMX97571.1 ATP-dependent DNA helicase RecG [Brevibacterium linens]